MNELASALVAVATMWGCYMIGFLRGFAHSAKEPRQ